MKKYIKSVGGRIYESEDLEIDELTGQLVKDDGDQLEVIVVDKEADDIVKLCDEVVALKKNDDGYERVVMSSKEYLKYYSGMYSTSFLYTHSDCGYSVYCALWAEGGLTYAAKWNASLGRWDLL